MLSNQSIKIKIWFINCRTHCYISTSTLYCFLYTIKSSFYSFARHIFSIIARVLLSIYLLDNFLQRLHEHLHYNLRKITKTYAFTRHIDSFFSLLFRKSFTLSISSSFRRHESFYFRDFYKSYDLDLFFVEVVIHIRKATSEFVNFSTLYRKSTSFSHQSNHSRCWFFKKKQVNRFECYAMFHLLVVIIQWILRFRIVEKTSSKFITLFTCFTTSARNRVEKYRCKFEIRIFFCFARQIFLSTYENRLTNLNKWRNVNSKNVLIVVEFNDINCKKQKFKIIEKLCKTRTRDNIV